MRIVIALGGNALDIECEKQLIATNKVASFVAPLAKDNEIILTHGNGPQVGMIYGSFENSNIDMPFSEVGAMSQGYIGYHLSSSLTNELNKLGCLCESECIVTRIEVDKNDKAFSNPSKAIGKWYKKDEINDLNFEVKYFREKDGYRRVIASPKPMNILELDQIKKSISKNNIVICCGGGGIPVIKYNNAYSRIDGVIDKDLASSLLADNIDADMLIILTSIDNVAINFRKDNEKILNEVNYKTLNDYVLNNEFEKGTIEPKVKACLEFVNNSKNRVAVITSIENLNDAIKLRKGTIIRY